MTQTEALKLALEALESCGSGHITDGGNQWYDEKLVDNSITAIKEALAQPEQEPVGFVVDRYNGANTPSLPPTATVVWLNDNPKIGQVLYAATPPQRKPLDMTEIVRLTYDIDEDKPATMAELFAFARAIEAAHGIKEKNT